MAPGGAGAVKIHKLSETPEFSAADQTILSELWNPKNHPGFSGRYSLAHAILPTGKSSAPHILNSHELFYILSGSGVMHIADESSRVGPGDAIEIPPGQRQWLENVGDTELCFLCIVDPGWSPEDETVL